jgi:DNA repair exonuclease SbcCD ATPase subunit
MRTFTFWFILALSSFLFILFVYYKNSQRTKKPLNFIFLTILFIAIFVLSIGTWYYCYGRKPKLANQAKTVATQAKTVAQTGATQAKNVAQTGATQVKNAAAKPVNSANDWWEKRKQEKEAKKQSQDKNNKDDEPKDDKEGDKGPKTDDPATDAPKTDDPAPTPEKPTDKPKTDKPATDESKTDGPTNNPDKPANNINKPKTVNDLIADARKQIDEICKTYKTQYNTLIDKLEEIKDNIINQTAELAKTPSQVTRINNLINEIDDLITETKKQLNKQKKESEFLERDDDSIISQIEELERIIPVTKEKKQELLKKDKAALIVHIATEIKTINDNLGKLYKEKNEKIGELKETTEQITTINEYITKLETINKNYETKMENLTNNKEIQARILLENQKQVIKLNKQLDILKISKKDLEDKEAFYTILKLSLVEAKVKYLQRKDTITVKNDTAFDNNKAFHRAGDLVFKIAENYNIIDGLCKAWNTVWQTDINRDQAIAENKLKNEKAVHAFEQQKKAEEKQILENAKRRAEVDVKKTRILERYHTFINQLYDPDGNIIPLSPESVKEMQKTFDNELENDRREYKKNENEYNKIETNITNKTNEKTNYKNQIKDQHGLLEETKSFNQTVIDLKVELAKNKDKSPVSQNVINDIDLDTLKEKIIRNQLIELNDKLKNQNPNINIHNKDLVEKAKVDYNALRDRLMNGPKLKT